MDLRTDVETAIESVLKAAVTLAGDRVYIERTREVEERSDDRPPMINIYFPKIIFDRDGGSSTRWHSESTFFLECWAEIDPARASRVVGDPDRLQARALDALTQQAVNALFQSKDFTSLFPELPKTTIEFGQDIRGQNRVGVSVVTFTVMWKGAVPYTEGRTYDDLKTIWWDTEVRDSPGATPDVPVISLHPDMQAQVTGLDEEG